MMFYLLAAPFALAIFIWALPKRSWGLVSCLLASSIGIGLWLQLPALEANTALTWQHTLFPGLDLALGLDQAGFLFSVLASTLWALVSIYSTCYLEIEEDNKYRSYYSSFALCIGATLGIAFSQNLFTFFVFYELLTICTYPLVIHDRNDESFNSGRTYLWYTLCSGQVLLFGLLSLQAMFPEASNFASGIFPNNTFYSEALLLCISLGFFVKAGVMPLHGWLPKAMVAPAPVSALLHAVAVVKAGVFGMYRVCYHVFGVDFLSKSSGKVVLLTLTSWTIGWASIRAFQFDYLKRRLAYSTIGHLSVMVLAFLLATPFALHEGLMHLVSHACMKITLFLCAGTIQVLSHEKRISRMAGMGKMLPITFSCFFLAGMANAILPLLHIKTHILSSLSGFTFDNMFIWLITASSILSVVYIGHVPFVAFLKKPTHSLDIVERAYPRLLAPILITTLLAIYLSASPQPLIDFLHTISEQSFGGIHAKNF